MDRGAVSGEGDSEELVLGKKVGFVMAFRKSNFKYYISEKKVGLVMSLDLRNSFIRHQSSH
jgi:tRNA-binding EMAP/Myf-like protein